MTPDNFFCNATPVWLQAILIIPASVILCAIAFVLLALAGDAALNIWKKGSPRPCPPSPPS